MKKAFSILALGILPIVAMASGSHTGGHANGHSGGHSMGHGASTGQPAQHQHGAHEHESEEVAAGRVGDPAKVNRTVEVSMDDNMRFSPSQLDFKAGDTVRFVLRNNGEITHEMVIGTVAELQEHAAMMRGNPGMQHAESNMISLAPGESGELIWTFDKTGSFDFACLIPGHLELGMTGKVNVN